MAKTTVHQEIRPSGKGVWKQRSDTGPHEATLPSGQIVRFVVPDSNLLIVTGKLPGELAEISLYAAAYPDGAEGYMADLAVRSMASDQTSERLQRAVREGIALGHWLVAHMLVDPQIDPEDVPDLPPMDVRMLLEFAERKRNTDAKGVQLPIAMLEEYARFLQQPGRSEADGDGERVDTGVPAANGRADEG